MEHFLEGCSRLGFIREDFEFGTLLIRISVPMVPLRIRIVLEDEDDWILT